MKLYQLTVERTEEDQEEEEVTIPRVDNMEQFQGKCSSAIFMPKSAAVSENNLSQSRDKISLWLHEFDVLYCSEWNM